METTEVIETVDVNYLGQTQEYLEIQKFFEGLLQTHAALRRLDVSTNECYISLVSYQFEYLTHVIELTDTHNFSKFYKRVNDDVFILGGMTVKRGA